MSLFAVLLQQYLIIYWPFHHQSTQLQKLILHWEDIISANKLCLRLFSFQLIKNLTCVTFISLPNKLKIRMYICSAVLFITSILQMCFRDARIYNLWMFTVHYKRISAGSGACSPIWSFTDMQRGTQSEPCCLPGESGGYLHATYWFSEAKYQAALQGTERELESPTLWPGVHENAWVVSWRNSTIRTEYQKRWGVHLEKIEASRPCRYC